jgi:hypothetical protein
MSFNKVIFSARLDGCGLSQYERQIIEQAKDYSETPVEFLSHVLSLKMDSVKMDRIASAFVSASGDENRQPTERAERNLSPLFGFRTF